MSFTTHNTFLFFSAILCLVPETLALETLLDRGCYSKPSSGKVCECVVLCVCRGSKYSEVVPDWLILNSDLYGTIHDCGPLRTQFDDVVVLAVVFFTLFSRSIGFQIFRNLKDIPLI